MSALMALAQRVEDTPLGIAILESRFAFPIIEGTHLVGLSVAVGLIFLTDLRLLGLVLRNVSIAQVLTQLRPYILWGFVLVFFSGALLTWAEAAEVLKSPATPFKFAFMLLASLNAAYFEFVTVPRHLHGIEPRRLPSSARFAGAASISLWVLVIVFGRLIAYLPK